MLRDNLVLEKEQRELVHCLHTYHCYCFCANLDFVQLPNHLKVVVECVEQVNKRTGGARRKTAKFQDGIDGAGQ